VPVQELPELVRVLGDPFVLLLGAGDTDRLVTQTRKAYRSNQASIKGLRQEPQPAAHALPASHVEDPDLAFIMRVWDRVVDGVNRWLLEIIEANLPAQGAVDEFDERGE
jgi:hypothetical protein